MARARNIKPGIMENEDLAECDHATRLLFVYLWMLADREGRLEDRPRRIGAKAMPYDGALDFDGMLSDLEKHGFILRYEVDGNKYIQVLNFDKHQSPHVKETGSKIPAPGSTEDASEEAPDKHQTSTVHVSDKPYPDTKPTPPRLSDSHDSPPITPQGGFHGSGQAVAIDTFLANCKAHDCKPVPEDDPVFDYAEETGIPTEFLRLCWAEFVQRNRESGKRYKDWRSAFRKCVRGRWYKLWWFNSEGEAHLTSDGQQAMNKQGESRAA